MIYMIVINSSLSHLMHKLTWYVLNLSAATMSTPANFQLMPMNPQMRPKPTPSRAAKKDLYTDVAVFKAVDQHAISVSNLKSVSLLIIRLMKNIYCH